MKKHFFPILLLFLVLILGALFAVEKVKNGELKALNESTRKNLAELKEQSHRDRAELERLRQQIDIYRKESDALRTRVAEGTGNTSGAPAGVGSAATDTANADGKASAPTMFQGLAKMYSDPKMKKALQAQQAMGIRMMYGEFFQKHPLDPDVAQRVSDILAERQTEMSAAGLAAMNPGGQEAGETADPKETQKHYDHLLKGTLGDEDYKALKDYEDTIGERFMLQQFDAQFSTAGAPLAAEQRETLLSIMSEERKNSPPSPLRNSSQNPQAQMEVLRDPEAVNSFVKDQEALNQRVLNRARESLSADQIVALERAQSQMLEMMRAQMTMAREMFGK